MSRSSLFEKDLVAKKEDRGSLTRVMKLRLYLFEVQCRMLDKNTVETMVLMALWCIDGCGYQCIDEALDLYRQGKLML